MLLTLILPVIFVVGFGLGYVVRARRVHRDLEKSPYMTESPTTTFGHARRAF